MQIEHKTENGTVLFVKVPDDYKGAIIEDDALTIWQDNKFGSWVAYESLGKANWQLIGLTSDITEQQAKIMVYSVMKNPNDRYKNYTRQNQTSGLLYDSCLDSFKSLMQHLQVYEFNPFIVDDPDPHSQYYGAQMDAWQEAQSITGKWIVLFKPEI